MNPRMSNLQWLAPLLLLAPAAESRQSRPALPHGSVVAASASGHATAGMQEGHLASPIADLQGRGLTTQLTRSQPRIDFDRVFYDRPGDGNLWVRGANYKARFGSDAVEFIPFLGSSAPRNYPVKFTLESVQVGDRSLPFPLEVEPVRDGGSGNVISYDRGEVVEHYVIETDSIEQRFRFDRPLADSGDLVIRVGVSSDLACSEDSDGFCFSGSRGGVRYGRAVVFDDAGHLSATPTRSVDGGLEIRVSSDFLATAEYPLTIDPLVTAFTLDNSGFSTSNPDVAFDETNQTYCVVWEFLFSQNDYDIFNQFYSATGELGLGTGIWIDATNDDWKRPKIANNNWADQFLVVAIEGGFTGVISGRTRAGAPNSMSSQFQISGVGEIGAKTNPDVGGDPSPVGPSYFCVVWESQREDFGDIHARRVSPGGFTFGNTFSIDSSSGINSQPSISKSCGMAPRSSQRWTVAWMRYEGTLNHDIWGAQVSWEGQVTQPRFPIDTSSSNDRWPTVSSVLDGSGDRPYLVGWFDGADISGRALAGSTPLTPRTNLTALEGGGNQGYQQLTACIESDGSTFLMAYAESRPATGYDIRVSEYDYSGGQLFCTDPNRAVASSTVMEINPFVTSRRSAGGPPGHFMGVWHQINGANDADVEGALFQSLGFGNNYCQAEFNTSGQRGTIRMEGSRSIANASMTLQAENCPANKPGLFFLGTTQVNVPFGEGRRCVGGSVKRMPVTVTNSAGVATRAINFSAPYANGIGAGAGVNYQYWFRDPAGGPAGFNLTNGLNVEHTP